MRILLVGHAFGPDLGSEPGNTWNWAWELSKHVEVTVLAHPQFRVETEVRLASLSGRRLQVVWVEVPRAWDPWQPGEGERGLRLHYLLWLRRALAVAKRLHQERTFDLVHHVSWNSVSAPSLLYRLPIPSIWGPVGGGQKAPVAFKNYFADSWSKEVLRNLRLGILPHLPFWRRAVRGFTLVLAVNSETQRLLIRGGARQAPLFLDCGIPQGFGLGSPPGPREVTDFFELLWAGRFERHKALPLALEALRLVSKPVRLWIAGDGPLRREWEALAHGLGVAEKVVFVGKLPWTEMVGLFKRVHAFLFTSLRDSSGSVVLEAMAYGLPVIVPDHQGVGDFVPPDAGIKVPVTGGKGENCVKASEDGEGG